MARVPRAADIGVSSFNVGSAAQIDIGVAKEIGRAGNAIGSAVASLGGAFAEIAGKAGAAQSAQAEADYVLDWNQKDFDVWTGLSKNETPDGTSWQAAAPTYTDTFKSHREDPKYASIPPDRKLRLDRQIAGSIQQRIIGEGGAARRYQAGQYGVLMKDLETRTQTTIGELGSDSPLVQDLPPTEGDSAYNRLYEERRSALHTKIDASVGLTISPKQAEELKAKVDADLFGTKLQWLQKNDPDAYEKALEEADKLEREDIETPKAGDATNETWRGPGSDGKPLGSLPPIYEDRVPTVADRRAIFNKGGVVVNLDTNWAKGDKQTTPMVVIPDNATKEQRAGAEAYAQAIAKVYQEKFGKSLSPRVVTRSENGRGRPFTIHTEPYSVNDSKAVEFFNSDEGRKAHAQILQQTLGSIPGVHFSIPHNPGKGDSGAAGKGGNEVQFAKALLGELKGGAKSGLMGGEDSQRVDTAQSGGFSANLSAYSPQKSGSKMEGDYRAARKGPDGKAEVRTLDDVLTGKSDYVTLAGNPSQYGKEYTIPSITYIDKSGKEHTLKNVKAVVHDTGSAFKNAGEDRFDVAIARDVDNKTMNANHGRWKQEGVQFVAGGEQSSETGIAQGRIPQDAIKQFAADYGVKIQEALAKDPQTPLAEVVSTEQMGAITTLLPEGVDASQITVEDAQDLIQSPEAQQVAQASSLNDQPPQTSAPVERPLGPIKAGAEFSIKTKYGNLKFRSEEWNGMNKDTLKTLKKDFAARKKIATQQNQALADEMMKAQVNSLEKEGKSLDPRFYSDEVISKAYPPGTPKRVAFEKRVAGLQNVAKIFTDAGDKNVEELQYEVDKMRPDQSKVATSEDYNIQVETYDKAIKKLDELVKLRREDPATAVEQSSIVKEVRAKFENGVPKSQGEKQMLIDARMTAQRQAGIPEALRSPITDREASALASDLESVPEEEIQTRLEDLANNIKENYGKDYTGVVLKSVIREYVRRGEQREEMMGIVQTMMNGGEIGPLDYQRAREASNARAVRVVNWTGDQIRRRAQRNEFEAMSDAAKQRMQEAAKWGLPGMVKQGLGKVIDAGRTANRWLEGAGKPSKEDIEKLRNDPAFKKQFERKYNLTPAESFMIMQGK